MTNDISWEKLGEGVVLPANRRFGLDRATSKSQHPDTSTDKAKVQLGPRTSTRGTITDAVKDDAGFVLVSNYFLNRSIAHYIGYR